jgi:hypothetical protein
MKRRAGIRKFWAGKSLAMGPHEIQINEIQVLLKNPQIKTLIRFV